MGAARTSDLWWKNAVVYCLDVETFLDWDGDGCGDLEGLTERVDHLAGLGVSCIWLMPFQPSPGRDDGYDITDHCGVDPRLGTFGDLATFLRTARDRGMRVIVDLVVNHTSDRHPWFQAARSSRDDPKHGWYVWADEEPPTPEGAVVFPDAEDSIWSYDEQVGRWYLHHFYRHQPDLDLGNPEVREEIAEIAGFWLQLGVDGFRVDAVPYLLEDVPVDPHELLRDLRASLSRRRGDALLLGEVNLPPDDLVRFFGDDDELQLLFDFPLMQRTHLAMARGEAQPIREALLARPRIPDDAQWAVFVRNHDELTLDQLSDRERQEVFDAFGPEPEHQLFGRGLRRRLPPMLAGDQDRIRLAYALCLSLPGTPVLFYGEEIGMGEDLDADGRMAVRTPMQWTDEPGGGFSTGDPAKLVRAFAQDPFGPADVNVAAQRRDPASLLTWFERAVRRRRETPELGWGAWQLLDAGHPAVLAHRCDWEGTAVVALHNLGEEPVDLDVPLGDVEAFDQVVDLLGTTPVRDLEGSSLRLRLERYGFGWWRLQARDRLTAP